LNQHVAHPWHGLSAGDNFPEIVNAYIEITSFDTVKYELDKESGLLKIDRPQQFSNLCPALYGFIPKTYCGNLIATFCEEKSGLQGIKGDGDPLDICVLSEKPINYNNIILQCIPIGGFRMIDNNEADDKIIAVLKNDLMYSHYTDVSQLPEAITKRLFHYFTTYKLNPQDQSNRVKITHTYDRAESLEVIRLAGQDYNNTYINA
jgi:inorganic pyrophosphatase